jgi:pimeloyl-ACP methyl ester carboxylesterase
MNLQHLFILLLLSLIGVTSINNHTSDPFEEWYLPIEDGKGELYIKEFGVGDTVLVIHGGFGAEHSYLLEAVAGLEHEFHFVFYDQRGSLRSPIADILVNYQKHIDDIDRIREELGIDKINLYAHSMGTLLAMNYLDSNPEKVKSMVLSGVMPPILKEGEKPFEKVHENGGILVSREEVENEKKKIGISGESNLTAKEQTWAWRIRFASVNLYDVSKWRYFRGGKAFYDGSAGQAAARTLPSSWDFTSTLKEHPYSVTILHGDHDYLDMGAEFLSSIFREDDNVQLNIIEKAGHAAWVDQPEMYKKLLLKGLLEPF